MSSVSAAVVNSISNTTNLTLTTGNTSGPSIILYAGTPTITFFANNSGISAFVANNSGFNAANVTTTNLTASVSNINTLTTSSLTTSSALVTGDVNIYRTYAPTTGAVFLGNSGSRYLYYDGSTYILNGASLAVGGNITATGDIIAFYSDDRLKDRFGNIPNALDKVKSLNGFFYSPNKTALNMGLEKNQLSRVGVSAQEVQAVLPEAVKPAPIDEKYLTVQYEKLVPLLIEAIKELTAKVEELEKK